MTGDTSTLSDPKAMRALAHPARLAILNRLGVEGSATATEVAEIAGITPSAASYHLRMLAKYGFVEDAPPRGDGRERVWRAVDRRLAVGIQPEDQPEVRTAKRHLIAALRRSAHEEAERALQEVEKETQEWRDAVRFARHRIRVNARELACLNQEIEKLIEPYLVRNRDAETAPEGARVSEVQLNLFPVPRRPRPGLPTEDHGFPRGGGNGRLGDVPVGSEGAAASSEGASASSGDVPSPSEGVPSPSEGVPSPSEGASAPSAGDE
ncbi:ArsR/SmtB family transcription factor [Nonomuraea fastidiosa]|jgi:DNA-binding transcriptional ArsR family regulator|uniref:ArsR/SmtB family transcription factor n=1 Tax=Nonomuraea fastidiosa TaxID=46173 RepID=UPI00366F34C2